MISHCTWISPEDIIEELEASQDLRTFGAVIGGAVIAYLKSVALQFQHVGPVIWVFASCSRIDAGTGATQRPN
jgi:hypothetical protein